MIQLYVLQSINKDFRYVGISNNVEQRLKQHNRGSTPSTRFYRPFIIVYQETFTDYASARTREIYLKSAAGRRWLDRTLSDQEEE